MFGEANECDRKRDQAVALSAEAHERPENEPPWTYFQTPERLSMQRGIAYVELGRAVAAVELMERGVASLPEQYRRDKGWHLGRLALAYAMAGEIDAACVNGVEALKLAAETGSVHPLRELRRMRQLLAANESHSAVRAFDDALRSLGSS
jgi:tetratricopeptide (TPR) repeat protein